VTTIGMLLDPVADKLLIAAAFITLVQFNPRTVPAWMAIIVIGREFLVSGLRSIAASEGFTIQASDLGKLKMAIQIVSVVAAIIDHHWTHLPWYFLSLPVHPIAIVSIWIMVAISLWSALDYFVAFWKQIDQTAVKRRRRRSFVLSRRRKRNDVPVV
jgi:CDP-diacylglycerol--glycerol-3-phosphate 3-phosphatidyltransferase